MLIDAAHPEETRVAVVNDGQIEDFDFEARDKRQLRGNIYLAKVTRVEPSLQAAFVEYGGNRHGFLAFSEIHPDYYQIPQEDRDALLAEEAAYAAQQRERDQDDDDDDDDDGDADDDQDIENDTDDDHDDDENSSDDSEDDDHDDNDADNDDSQEMAESIAAAELTSDDDDDDSHEDEEDDAVSERPRRRIAPNKRYKIQEVIKRRQILLIQVVKEERGNKGAAVTTYLSLAGRYGVLMPNTARGGGISRKITNATDRKRLKKITQDFDVPQGMGLIIRTAGAKRTKAEISRDYDYLMRLWSRILERTMDSIAPCLIHEEGDLVLRAVRDLYDREVESIHVEGREAYDQARNVVSLLMPEHVEKVEQHEAKTPLFIAHAAENQLDNIFSPTVTLPSGGYIVINQTEALVAIDVNSGKATRERNIETTAVKTNLEAAEEACRQMRLRDLAGLIVIDFIDMEENKHNRQVEKKMKESLSFDRARVQCGRISQFGLFEISRQRRRAGVLELSSEPCQACSGTGRVRSVESAALQLLRAIGERIADPKVDMVKAQAPAEVALYILNHKRESVTEMEEAADVAIRITAKDDVLPGDFDIEATGNGKVVAYKPITPPKRKRKKADRSRDEKPSSLELIDDEPNDENGVNADEDDTDGNGRKRRRGRRGGRRRRGNEDELNTTADNDDNNRGNRRGRKRRSRRRTPDVALDGGEMFDAIASAPFLVSQPPEADNDDEEDGAANDAQGRRGVQRHRTGRRIPQLTPAAQPARP